MNAPTWFCLSFAVLTLMGEHSQAIPQDFGAINAVGGGFGSPLEDRLRRGENWINAAQMPGDWKAVEGQPKQKQLAPGPVFGVKADLATLEQADDGSVRRVVVHFSSKTSGLAEKQLWERLRTNITTFTTSGAKKTQSRQSGKSTTDCFEGAGLVICLKKSTDGVDAQVTPSSSLAASKTESKAATAASPAK